MNQRLSASEELSQANAWIEAAIERFASSDQYFPDMAALRSRLKIAAESVRTATSASSPEFRKQISLYRENLARLQELLPTAQIRLLVRRQRIGSALTAMRNLECWTESNRISR